jgi:hypothetical protein
LFKIRFATCNSGNAIFILMIFFIMLAQYPVLKIDRDICILLKYSHLSF